MKTALPDKWFYVQVFLRGERVGHAEYFVVVTSHIQRARDLAVVYIEGKWPNKGIRDIYFYRNNYKNDSRNSIVRGEVIYDK